MSFFKVILTGEYVVSLKSLKSSMIATKEPENVQIKNKIKNKIKK